MAKFPELWFELVSHPQYSTDLDQAIISFLYELQKLLDGK